MKKILLLPFTLFSVLALCSLPLAAQADGLKAKEAFVSAPDSIFPLLTLNNRLDCIDFIENNMQARVRNKLDSYSELTRLDSTYLSMKISEKCITELYIVNPETICLVETFFGPVPDSKVSFYTKEWGKMDALVERPQATDFLQDGIDPDIRGLLTQIPLMRAYYNQEDRTLQWELQTGELSELQRNTAKDFIHPVIQKVDF